MIDIQDMKYHPTSEKAVEVLMQKTQNDSPLFFRILFAYNLCKVASMMRCKVRTHDRGDIPINMYAINLALSGQGKGHSTNIIEEQVIHHFKDAFLQDTFNAQAEQNIIKVANRRSIRKNTDPDDEVKAAQREFENLGELAFSFDSATPAAIKQYRQKLLLANAGSMNLEIDEIGSNLINNTDALNVYLELFDVGKTKQKLTKNTAENTRGGEIDGKTPANAMLFGTPSKLLDGGKTESEFISFLDTGYARRCFFGYQVGHKRNSNMTAEEIYDRLTATNNSNILGDIADVLADRSDIGYFDQTLAMSKETSIAAIEYQRYCENIADKLEEHQEIQKSEISHRYFKAIKLAGAYAFYDGSPELTIDHLQNAIKLAEDSGEAFNKMLARDKAYVKLAKYLSQSSSQLTQVDLTEELPFYKGSEQNKRQLMDMAVAWGHRHNIVIKRSVSDGIEFFEGETMQEATDGMITISYSNHFTEGYRSEKVNFADLHKLTQMPNMQFVNHELEKGYRKDDNIIPGFDCIVLDVDDGRELNKAKLLLRNYTYHMYTTKRHTEENNRFRIILPLSHNVTLNAVEFKEFMQNVFQWLPFSVDEAAKDRCRKWSTHPGEYFTNSGETLEAMTFIPRTSKCEKFKQRIVDLSDLSNLERWFINDEKEKGRNNRLIRYALMLVDSNYDFDTVKNNVVALNNKLPEPLCESEIYSTVMQTVSRKLSEKQSS